MNGRRRIVAVRRFGPLARDGGATIGGMPPANPGDVTNPDAAAIQQMRTNLAAGGSMSDPNAGNITGLGNVGRTDVPGQAQVTGSHGRPQGPLVDQVGQFPLVIGDLTATPPAPPGYVKVTSDVYQSQLAPGSTTTMVKTLRWRAGQHVRQAEYDKAASSHVIFASAEGGADSELPPVTRTPESPLMGVHVGMGSGVSEGYGDQFDDDDVRSAQRMGEPDGVGVVSGTPDHDAAKADKAAAEKSGAEQSDAEAKDDKPRKAPTKRAQPAT